MKIVEKTTLYGLREELGQATGHINGVPYNHTFTVKVVCKKGGFFWTLDPGNRIKNCRGPYSSPDEAVQAARTHLGYF